MPDGNHQLNLETPIWRVWNFVSDMNKWAPLVPGYVKHEIINERQSTWMFKGEVGIVQKTVHLQIDIIEWQAPSKVTFVLTGLNENVKGSGFFMAESLHDHTTKMTSNLSITAKGMIAPMVNKVLKSMVPKKTKELTEAIALKIEEVESMATYRQTSY